MDFQDNLAIATMLAMQDHIRNTERQQQNRAEFFQQRNEEIANRAAALGQYLADLLSDANLNRNADETIEGVKLLTPYGFYQVLKAQGSPPTTEQQRMIDMYSNSMSISMTGIVIAAQQDGSERQRLEQKMELSAKKAGSFWLTIFNAIHITGKAEQSISTIANHYCDIVINFAALGKLGNNVAGRICESFIHAVYQQYQACPIHSPSTEAAWREPKQAIARIALDLEKRAGGDDGGISMKDILPNLYRILLFDLTFDATGSIQEKSIMLDEMLVRCEVDHEMSGQMIYNSMATGDVIAKMLNDTRENILGIVAMYGVQAGRDHDAVLFLTECKAFLNGVEQEMASRWPNHGYGNLTNGIVKSLSDAFSRGGQ